MDLEAGLLVQEGDDEEEGEEGAADRAPARRPAPPRRTSVHKLPHLPVLFAIILAQDVGGPVTFPVGSSLWFDLCTFGAVLTVIMLPIVTLIAAAAPRDGSRLGRRFHVISTALSGGWLLYIFCVRIAPQHLGVFASNGGTWFMAPLELYRDYHAPDVEYACPPPVPLANASTTGAHMESQSVDANSAADLAPRYDNGFLCGSRMNPFFLHWRPVVWGMMSWKRVAFFGWYWPAVIGAQRGLDGRPCLMGGCFLCAVPFIMLLSLTEGMIGTTALARMVYIYLFDVFRRIYHVCHGTPAVDEGGQPEVVKITDIVAVLLVVWWLVLPWPKPEGIEQFIPMATGEHVDKVLKNKTFKAKIKKSTTINMIRRSTSMMLTGKAEPDAKNLEQKRAHLIEDAQSAAVEKLEKGKSAPKVFTMRGIRREHVLEDSLLKLKDANTFQLLAQNFNVSFQDEPAIDAGGVTRDWFHSMAQALARDTDEVSGDKSLFRTTTDGTLLPRNMGIDDDADMVSDEIKPRLDDLFTAGRFLALAVLKKQPLPLAFGSVLMKTVCDEFIDYRDVRRLDPEFYRVRVEMIMKEGGVAEMNDALLGEDLTFVSAAEETVEPKNLMEGGHNIKVTEENKKEYVMLLCEAHLCNGIRKELAVLLAGFHEVLELENLKANVVTHRDLSLLISGVPTLDVEDWRRHTAAHSERDEQIIQWFWEVVGELDDEQRARLLQFSTGSSRVPHGGFEEFEPQFKIVVTAESGEHLPHSHTCVNQLMLAKYESREQLKDKIVSAIEVGDIAGFGFA